MHLDVRNLQRRLAPTQGGGAAQKRARGEVAARVRGVSSGAFYRDTGPLAWHGTHAKSRLGGGGGHAREAKVADGPGWAPAGWLGLDGLDRARGCGLSPKENEWVFNITRNNFRAKNPEKSRQLIKVTENTLKIIKI
jgi:hypothetical protein